MNRCLSAAVCLLFIPSAANAAETTTYTYDALGRLVGTTTSGGPVSGTVTSTTFDNVDNRTNYSVAPGGMSNCQFFADDREGNDEFTIYVQVRRTGVCSGPVTINYVTADGTAYGGVHYSYASGSVTFQTPNTEQYIRIYPNFGSVTSNVNLYVNISIGSGPGALGDAQAVVTIIPSN